MNKKANREGLIFLLYADTLKNQDLLNKNLVQVLAKSKTESELIILGSWTGAATVKEFADLVAKKRAFHAGDASALPTLLDECKGGTVFLVDDHSILNINNALSTYANNKKLFAGANACYIGEFTKQSGKSNEGFLGKVKRTLGNFFSQVFVAGPLKDFSHRYYFFPVAVVERHAGLRYSTAIQLLEKAAYEQETFATFALTSKEYTNRITGFHSNLGTGVKFRINWFVKEPLAVAGSNPNALYRFAFFLLFAFALVAMPAMSFKFGMTWDEKRHNSYGHEMLNYFTTFGEDTTCLNANSSTNEFRYYGEQFNVISAFANTYISPFDEYETRHFLNALYGFLAILFAALAAKELGSWRTGVFAFLLLLLSPVFMGHSMNNPTDIPFAAGFSMAVYFLIKILKNLPAPRFSYIFLSGMGVGMAMGSRVGGILLYAYAGLFLGIAWLVLFKQKGWALASKQILTYAKILLLLMVIGHCIGIFLWPFALQAPLTNWYEALKQSTEGAYFTYNHELFEGVRMYMGNVPWYYLPKFILINAPLAVIAGLVLIPLAIFTWKRNFKQPFYAFGLILFALVFPIFYAEVQSMYYYNGWRHYLFIYPPLIVLSALGWETLMTIVRKKALVWGVGAVIAVLLILPLKWMVKNHPYESVYFNEIVGGVDGAYGNYETDYYSNSCREAAEWLAKQEPNKKILVAINNEPLTASYYAQRINPNMQFVWVREYEEQKPDWDYAIFTSRTYSKNELTGGSFPPKGTIHTVNADHIPLAAVVKREIRDFPLGYKAMEARKPDSAIYYFERALAYNPKDEEAYRMLGFAWFAKGDTVNSKANFEKAIELYPENCTAYHDLGLMYYSVAKNYDKALYYFEKAYSYKYNYSDSYFASALCYYDRGDYLNGIPFLEKALKRGAKNFPDVYYYLGVGYANTGNFKKSQETLEYGLALNPNMLEAYKVLADVYGKQNKQEEAKAVMQRYYQLGGK